jgi:hypothetical protein
MRSLFGLLANVCLGLALVASLAACGAAPWMGPVGFYSLAAVLVLGGMCSQAHNWQESYMGICQAVKPDAQPLPASELDSHQEDGGFELYDLNLRFVEPLVTVDPVAEEWVSWLDATRAEILSEEEEDYRWLLAELAKNSRAALKAEGITAKNWQEWEIPRLPTETAEAKAREWAKVLELRSWLRGMGR